MQHKRLAAVLILIAWSGMPPVAHSSEGIQKNGFTISFPPGWVEMPRDVLDAYEKGITQLAPNAPVQHYDYGFQLDSLQNWFEYPYILVQIKNLGRIPQQQFEKLDGYSVQGSLEKHKKGLSPIMSDIQAGKMYYDKQANMIWLRIESDVVEIGPISGVSVMVPTEKGFIQVSGYSLKNDFPRYEPVFRGIAMSVTPAPELAYKPTWSDRLPSVVSGIDWSQVAGKAVAGAIIGGIIALILGFRRKKSK